VPPGAQPRRHPRRHAVVLAVLADLGDHAGQELDLHVIERAAQP
jgi:hypothetical protein